MSLIQKIFSNSKVKHKKLVLVGEVNSGKSTIANRFSEDFTGAPMSGVSEIPHETREITTLEHVDFNVEGKKLDLTLCDTPGIAQSIDYREFMEHGLTEPEAIQRAKEATSGVVAAIKFLKEIDLALLVMDATKPPFDQISLTVLGTLEMHNKKTIIVANKTDLNDSNVGIIKETFPHIPVVGTSALYGDGIDELYSRIANGA